MEENKNYYSNFYRPTTFAQVIGQQCAIDTLKRIAKSDGIIARSIVLRGQSGIGKTTLARLFGKAMNSTSIKHTNDISGNENVSGLYYEYTMSDLNSEEKVSNLKKLVETTPNGRRVIVFDECNSFSNNLMSSFVQIIESGSMHTMFVFTTAEDVAPNIKTLSLSLELEKIKDNVLKQYLMNIATANSINIDDNGINKIVAKSFGKVRDALNTLQSYVTNGENVISSPYDSFKYFVLALCKKDKVYQVYLDKILSHNIVEIRKSICLFIKNLYICQGDDEIMTALRNSGIQDTLFGFFYSQVAQNAMKDEYGIEILLRSFVRKFNIQ